MIDSIRLDFYEAFKLAKSAVLAVGTSEAVADSLASAILSAEFTGNRVLGFAHLVDYLDAFVEGRILGNVEPEVNSPTPVILRSNAKGGIAHLGFDWAFDRIKTAAGRYGVSVFSQCNGYTAAELGYYTRRLAVAGFVSIAVSNATAQATTAESRRTVYGTNPIAFGAPLAGGRCLVIDQASSVAAFVNIREAARRAQDLPEGWALDHDGNPTRDAVEALKGMLLVFGGRKGANIALLIEILAAGMTGGNWSIDAPSYATGNMSPGVGMLIIALNPAVLTDNFEERLTTQAQRLSQYGIYIPGGRPTLERVDIPAAVVDKIASYAGNA